MSNICHIIQAYFLDSLKTQRLNEIIRSVIHRELKSVSSNLQDVLFCEWVTEPEQRSTESFGTTRQRADGGATEREKEREGHKE